MGHHPFPTAVCYPDADGFDLLFLTFERSNHWSGAVEHGNRAAPVFGVAINIRVGFEI
jgi:hypothetical protein